MRSLMMFVWICLSLFEIDGSMHTSRRFHLPTWSMSRYSPADPLSNTSGTGRQRKAKDFAFLRIDGDS